MEEPVVGAATARRLGRPEGIRELARVLRDTGSGLDQLVSELRGQVGDLVPRDWDGQSATAFRQHMEQELNIAARASQRAQRLATAALRLAGGLEDAWRLFAEAQVLAVRFQLSIEERPSGPWVYAHGPDTPETRVAHEQAWAKVNAALQQAEVARSAFRWDIAEDWRQRMDILVPLALGAMLGMGRRGTPRVRTTGPPPRFDFGEIKSTNAVRQGMTQLVDRGVQSGRNYALATYDGRGNVYLQVFTMHGNTLTLTWERQIGTVGHIPPGLNTAQLGNHMEPHVRHFVSQATGRQFRAHHPSGGGPDLIPR